MEKQSTSRLLKLVVSALALFLLLACGLLFGGCKKQTEGHTHTYEKASGGVAAKCFATGYDVYTCKDCKDTYVIVTPATGSHSFDQSGNCTVCGISKAYDDTALKAKLDEINSSVTGLKEDLSKVHKHAFPTTGTEVAATCEGNGFTIVTCPDCGSVSIANVTKALGHDWEDKKTVEPTCSAPGYTLQECSRCSSTQQVNPKDALGHKWDGVTEKEVAATCTERGYKLKYCERCEESYVDTESYTPALGHSYSQYDPSKNIPATCSTPEQLAYPCTRCGEIDYRPYGNVNPNNHHVKDEDWFVDKEATCIDGLRHGTCEYCGKENIQDIIPGDSSKHVFYEKVEENDEIKYVLKDSEGNVTKTLTANASGEYVDNGKVYAVNYEAACEKPGAENRLCLECGHWEFCDESGARDAAKESEGRKALEHKPESETPVKTIIKVYKEDQGGANETKWNTIYKNTYICEVCEKEIVKLTRTNEDGEEEEYYTFFDAENEAHTGKEYHSWEDYKVENDELERISKDPTCIEDGVLWHKCKDTTCEGLKSMVDGVEMEGVWYKEVLPALGHDFSLDDKDNANLKCTEAGKVELECSKCHEKFQFTVERLGASENDNYFDTYEHSAAFEGDWELKVKQLLPVEEEDEDTPSEGEGEGEDTPSEGTPSEGEGEDTPSEDTPSAQAETSTTPSEVKKEWKEVELTFKINATKKDKDEKDVKVDLKLFLMPKGHTWSETSKNPETPTCFDTVTTSYKCTVCNTTKEESVTLGHLEGKEATFVKYDYVGDGYCPAYPGSKMVRTQYTYCSECGYIYSLADGKQYEPVPLTDKYVGQSHFPFDLNRIEDVIKDWKNEKDNKAKLALFKEYVLIWDTIDEWYKTNNTSHYAEDLVPYLFCNGSRNCREGRTVNCFFCRALLYQFPATDHQFEKDTKKGLFFEPTPATCTKQGTEGYAYCRMCGLWINLTENTPIQNADGTYAKNAEEAKAGAYIAPLGHTYEYGIVIEGDCTHRPYMGWYCTRCFTPVKFSSTDWNGSDTTNGGKITNPESKLNGSESETDNCADLFEFFEKEFGEEYFESDKFKAWDESHGYLNVWEEVFGSADDKQFEDSLTKNAYLLKRENGTTSEDEEEDEEGNIYDNDGYLRGPTQHGWNKESKVCVPGSFEYTYNGKNDEEKESEGTKVVVKDGKLLCSSSCECGGTKEVGECDDCSSSGSCKCEDLKKIPGYTEGGTYSGYCTICGALRPVGDHNYMLKKYKNVEDAKNDATEKGLFEEGWYDPTYIHLEGNVWKTEKGKAYKGDLEKNIHYIQWKFENSFGVEGFWAVIKNTTEEGASKGWTASCWFVSECTVCSTTNGAGETPHLDPKDNNDLFLWWKYPCTQNATCPICGKDMDVRKPEESGKKHSLIEMPVGVKNTDGTYTWLKANGETWTFASNVEKRVWEAFYENNPLENKAVSQRGICDENSTEKAYTVYVCKGCLVAWYKNFMTSGKDGSEVTWTKGESFTWSDNNSNDTYNYAVVENKNTAHTYDFGNATWKYYAYSGSSYVELTAENYTKYDVCTYPIYKQATVKCTVCGGEFKGKIEGENGNQSFTKDQYNDVSVNPRHYVVPAENYFKGNSLNFTGSTATETATMKFTCVVCGKTSSGEYKWKDIYDGKNDKIVLLVNTLKGSSGVDNGTVAFRKTGLADKEGYKENITIEESKKTSECTVTVVGISYDSETKKFSDAKKTYTVKIGSTTKNEVDQNGSHYSIKEITVSTTEGSTSGASQDKTIGWSARYIDTVTTEEYKKAFGNGAEGAGKKAVNDIQKGGNVTIEENTEGVDIHETELLLTYDTTIDLGKNDVTVGMIEAKENAKLTIKNGTITINKDSATTQSGNHSLALNVRENATLVLDNVTVEYEGDDNSKDTWSAICMSDRGAKLEIKNSVIINLNKKGTALGTNTNYDNTEISIENSVLIGGETGLQYLGGKKLTLKDSMFYGGEMGALIRAGEDVKVENCTFISGSVAGEATEDWKSGSEIPKAQQAALTLGNGSSAAGPDGKCAYGSLTIELKNCKFMHGRETDVASETPSTGLDNGKNDITSEKEEYKHVELKSTATQNSVTSNLFAEVHIETGEADSDANHLLMTVTAPDKCSACGEDCKCKVTVTMDKETFHQLGGKLTSDGEAKNPFGGLIFKSKTACSNEEFAKIVINVDGTNYEWKTDSE